MSMKVNAKMHNQPYYLKAEDVLQSYDVDHLFGLSTEEHSRRKIDLGTNTVILKERSTILDLIKEQLQDYLVQMLVIVSIVSTLLASFDTVKYAFVEPIVIVTILILNSMISIAQTVSTEKSLEALKKLHAERVTVLRNGEWSSNIPSSDLVPGDIIALSPGSKIPADARIISIYSKNFGTDESILTGESTTCHKMVDSLTPGDSDTQEVLSVVDQANMIFSGTIVNTGKCIAVVTATASNTAIGKIGINLEDANKNHQKSPLTVKLNELTVQLGRIVGAICVSVWVINIPKFNDPAFKNWYVAAFYYAKTSVALGIAALPEGLPAVITMCLSIGASRLANQNAIVRNLPAVESLGATSVICTDKTGTLTTNQMTVRSLVTCTGYTGHTGRGDDKDRYMRAGDTMTGHVSASAAGSSTMTPFQLKERDIKGNSYDPRGMIQDFDSRSSMQSLALQDIALICSICNDAKLVYDVENDNKKFGIVGEPTEAALKVLVEKMGVAGYDQSFDNTILIDQFDKYWHKLYTIDNINEFSRDRKLMSVVCHKNIEDNGHISSLTGKKLLVKGGAELVLDRCTSIKLEDGTIIPLSKEKKELLVQKISQMSSAHSLRCLAVAIKDLTFDDVSLNREEISDIELRRLESDLVFVGVCGIIDPPREEVRSTVLQCGEAGIRLVMITGDSKETAVSVAKAVGIITSTEETKENIFSGKEFFTLPQEAQLNLMKSGNKVFYRTESHDKQKIIGLLDALGEITAMTGDGVNDAPALKQASVGIAMGITGTDVAKQSADIILTDDNFATIVSAVEEGRRIFTNMQAFVCFLISCNIGEVIGVLTAAVLRIPEPLTPLHLLWVNLVTDGPPAVALSCNPPDRNVMQTSPRNRKDPIISKWILVRYLITGSYVGFATVSVFIWWYLNKGVTLHQLMHWSECTSCDSDVLKMKVIPQTMALSVLVTTEIFKALSSVSFSASLLSMPPWKNSWLMLATLSTFIVHFIILYTPILSDMLGVFPLTSREWQVSIMSQILLKYINWFDFYVDCAGCALFFTSNILFG